MKGRRDTVLDFFSRRRSKTLPLRPAEHSERNPATSPVQPEQSNPSPEAHTSSSADLSEDILNKALSILEPEEREAVRPYANPEERDADVALQAAYAAALAKKDECEKNRWRWEFRGKQIVLRDQAAKVITWLDRFKTIGDLFAGVCPVHVRLPWAAIRFLLEVVIAESKHMAALLTGMSLALFMAHRTQAHLEYLVRLEQLPDVLVDANFEEALTKLYAHVLKLVARAILVFHKDCGFRWQVLWETPTLEAFESESDKLAERVDSEANICHRRLHLQDRTYDRAWKAELDENLSRIQGLARFDLDAVLAKVDLGRLKFAEGAEYNSYTEGAAEHCLAETRTELIQQIVEWANSPDQSCQSVFWLCGKAGTGKSTISRTVASMLDKSHHLGASFFFKRGGGDRGNARRFFPTLAVQLADRISHVLRRSIASALDLDSSLCDKNLQEQFEKLILQPLQQAAIDMPESSPPYVLLIDALDECESHHDIRMILKLLVRVEINSLRLRVFVTSRPELPVQLGFQDMGGNVHKELRLEDIEPETIKHDLRLYLKYRLEQIKRENDLIQPIGPLPADWPGVSKIETLVELATPLFVFASTLCRYIEDHDFVHGPQERLEFILQQRTDGCFNGLDAMYGVILDQIRAGRDKSQQSLEAFLKCQEILASIVILADPLPLQSLGELLDIPAGQIQGTLSQVQSVLYVPHTDAFPIRLLHISFRDFFLNPRTRDQNKFYVEENKIHAGLAQRCLQRLSRAGTLRKDICNVGDLGYRRIEITQAQIANCISAEVAYACSHWVGHVVQSQETLDDDGQVHRFLHLHFAHWLEALSWLGRLSSALEFICQLRSLVKEEKGESLVAFLDDARQFYLRNRYVIDLAPLQLYYSALYFTPTQSVIRKTFAHHCFEIFDLLPDVPLYWGREIQTLEGHEDSVLGVLFSPDSRLIASWSLDKTVRLWDARTGEQVQKLLIPSIRMNVIFSPDGSVLAATDGFKVIVWDLSSSDIKTLNINANNLADRPGDLVFLLDGEVVAFRSSSSEICLWDARSGRELQIIQETGGAIEVCQPECFPGVIMVASTSDHGSAICLRNLRTGEIIHRLKRYDERIHSLTFSPDGLVLASELHNYSIDLWNTQTGQHLGTIEKGMDEIIEIIFSLEGSLVATRSLGGDSSVWNARNGEHIHSFQQVCRLTFLPDGLLAVSHPGITRLWDVLAGQHIGTYEGGYCVTAPFWSIRIFPATYTPNRKLMAGRIEFDPLDNKSLGVWNARTCEQICKLEVPAVGPMHTDMDIVSLSGDGVTLASAPVDNSIKLYTVHADHKQHSPEPRHPHAYPFELILSPDGKVVASVEEKQVRLWDTQTAKSINSFRSKVSRLYRVLDVFLTNEVVAISRGSRTQLWNIHTGEELGPEESRPRFDVMACSRDDGQIILGATEACEDNYSTVFPWDSETGERMCKIKIEGNVEALDCSACGKFVVNIDSKIQVWDLHTRRKIREFRQRAGNPADTLEVAIVGISPLGEMIASASDRNIVQAWNVQTGEETFVGKPAFTVQEFGFYWEDDDHAIAPPCRDGTFAFNVRTLLPFKTYDPAAMLAINDQWLHYRGRDLLWIPHEYRGIVGNIKARQRASCPLGKFCAIGHDTGGVSFFRCHDAFLRSTPPLANPQRPQFERNTRKVEE